VEQTDLAALTSENAWDELPKLGAGGSADTEAEGSLIAAILSGGTVDAGDDEELGNLFEEMIAAEPDEVQSEVGEEVQLLQHYSGTWRNHPIVGGVPYA